jgi:D-serine deaminase-like pyridoxal phosphate-dependent protein
MERRPATLDPFERIRRIPSPVIPAGLDTPCVVVDLDILEGNLARMAADLAARRVNLRPHAKTHKSVNLARMQMASGAGGLTVGTIGEAEVLVAARLTDLFVAYPLWLSDPKARRLRALLDAAPLIVGADSAQGAVRLADAARGAAHRLRVAIEIDSGDRRSGTTPDAAPAVALAARSAGLEVIGVYTHGGHAYDDPSEVAQAANDEIELLAAAAGRLEAEGFEVSLVSAGSTPTARLSATGRVNEERPGTYVFNDRQQVGLGGAAPEEVALFVVATVVSTSVPGQVVLDAGGKTLAKDRAPWLDGFGAIPAYPDARIPRTYDYHGVVVLPDGSQRPTLGETIAIVPNHVCPVVNLADSFVVARGGAVVDRWPVDARGRSG